jgi:hypothetical protein
MQQFYSISPKVYELMQQGGDICQGNVHLGWWLNMPNGGDKGDLLARYADEFLDSTLYLLERFLKNAVYGDAEALPILNNGMHFLELALKASHEYRRQILNVTTGECFEPVKKKHQTGQLLADLKDLCDRKPTTSFLSIECQRFVAKLDNLNIRQAFRYPFDTKDKSAWEQQPVVPMQAFKHELDIYGRELQSLYWRLRECLNQASQT